MTPEGLSAVLQGGRSRRMKYYQRRSNSFTEGQLQALVRSFPEGQPGISVSHSVVMDSLTSVLPPEEAERLFVQAWRKGVVSKQGDNIVIPIPSMHAWMEQCYRHRKLGRDDNGRGGRRDTERPKRPQGPYLER